jgi:hypothetical protein
MTPRRDDCDCVDPMYHNEAFTVQPPQRADKAEAFGNDHKFHYYSIEVYCAWLLNSHSFLQPPILPILLHGHSATHSLFLHARPLVLHPSIQSKLRDVRSFMQTVRIRTIIRFL